MATPLQYCLENSRTEEACGLWSMGIVKSWTRLNTAQLRLWKGNRLCGE